MDRRGWVEGLKTVRLNVPTGWDVEAESAIGQ
jgi:hypothetical protein